MEEKDTYQRVAIPMTDEQAHEVFACETCKGFSDSLQVLKEFIDIRATVGMEAPEFHKHLNLVASPDCDGQCVTGETMTLSCPHCKVDDSADRVRREVQGGRGNLVYFNWYCHLPTEYTCPYCDKHVVLEGNRLSIVLNHNAMKGDLDTPSIAQQKIAMQKMLEARTATADAKGYGVPMQENEES